MLIGFAVKDVTEGTELPPGFGFSFGVFVARPQLDRPAQVSIMTSAQRYSPEG
jgi:hypothetical protein